MTRDEWKMQMLILTHEETDAEHYNTALHKLEDHDAEQRQVIDMLREALQGILEIGKRDMTNPKYDGYFEQAQQALQEVS